MKLRTIMVGAVGVAWLAGCATPPQQPVEDDIEPPVVSHVPAPMVEYPPIEPVEPPPPEPQPATPPARTPAQAQPAPPATSVPPAAAPVPVIPEISAEEQQMALLLADLQRYGALPSEDVKRELTTLTQVLTKQRNDANRVRLAMLYTLARSNPQDDQRALQLLENVAKSGNGSAGVKQLASVLQAQISERVRAVRDEQQKADAAIQKLEALRNMERSLLRERVRSGGGGSGSGSGGSSGGGGGSGGSAGGN